MKRKTRRTRQPDRPLFWASEALWIAAVVLGLVLTDPLPGFFCAVISAGLLGHCVPSLKPTRFEKIFLITSTVIGIVLAGIKTFQTFSS